MSLTFHWFLPTYGDSRDRSSAAATGADAGTPAAPGRPAPTWARSPAPPSNSASSARSPPPAPGARTPGWPRRCWTEVTERLKFLVAFRPGPALPHARRPDGRDVPAPVPRPAAAQRGDRGRGRGAARLRRLPGQGRPVRPYRRVSSPWCGRCGAASGSAWTAHHVRVEEAHGCSRLPDPVPPIYFGGSSPAAGTVAAQHGDVYLTWGEPPGQPWPRSWPGSASLAADARTRAAVRHPAARDRPGHRAGRMGPGRATAGRASATQDIGAVQAGLGRSESEGQRRMLELQPAAPGTNWRSSPTCGPASGWSAAAPAPPWWAATPRSPTGSRSISALGITEFMLSGHPHVEEAYWFGEGVLPILSQRGLWTNPVRSTGHRASVPFGAAVSAS